MSYSLFLHFKPRRRLADLLKYVGARKHYKQAKDGLSYRNEDSGVYFALKLRLGWDFLLRRTVKSAEFEINYGRPSFFGIEAEKELSAFVAAFHPRIEDPQMEGMGDGPYSSEGFQRGWNFGNRFAIAQIVTKEGNGKIATLPAAVLSAVWEWNYDCAERREKLNLRHYVPTVLFWRIGGHACRIAVWGEAMPILLPRVDYIVVVRQLGQSRVSLVSWSEIIEIANRAGFDTSKEPLELRFLTPPPAIVEWTAGLTLIELKPQERLGAYQVIDEELIPATSSAAAGDEMPPSTAATAPTTLPSFDATHDTPKAFGYKACWFAIKTSHPAAVVETLELGEATAANWATGIAAAYGDGDWIFVSPPVNGWVLAASARWAYPVAIEQNRDIGERFDAGFARLTRRFDEVQFFGSHRVVDFVAWARAIGGKPIRIFSYVGGGEGVLANVGAQTPEEAQLRLADLSGLSPTDANDRMFALAEQQDRAEQDLRKSGLSPHDARARVCESNPRPFPDETDSTALAARWSIDPTGLEEEEDHPPGVGFVARLPKTMRE
jgi:hypothetical protein